MSLYDYQQSQQASSDYDFYSLLMAAMRNADTFNLDKLKAIFPEEYEELSARYNAPGGILPSEKLYYTIMG